MKCKSCGYSLWRLTNRNCPECGTPYRIDDFDFVVDSVKFCCPSCSAAYYGTDARGHLYPPAFDCVSCQRHLTINDMIVEPANPDGQTAPTNGNPWLTNDRSALGKLLATIGVSIAAPASLIKDTPTDSGWYKATQFAGQVIFLSLLLGIAPLSIFIAVADATSGRMMTTDVARLLLPTLGIPLGSALALWLFIGLYASVTHSLLRSLSNSDIELSRTLQAAAYSSGPLAILAIPCLGPYLVVPLLVWCAVNFGVMLAVGHNNERVTAGTIVAAMILGPVLIVTVVIAAIVAINLIM